MLNLKNGLSCDIAVESIADFYADAIILPSNTTLDWESDLTEQVRKRAGRSMLEKTIERGPIQLGEALATTGGGLLATFIIHVALFQSGEVYHASVKERENLMQAVIKNSFLRCLELGVESLGVPNIGICLGFEDSESARIMLTQFSTETILKSDSLREVHIVVDDMETLEVFGRVAYAYSV
jgi:O-acetyl-ADP-ribose deacetylase (regulator of RNase III)